MNKKSFLSLAMTFIICLLCSNLTVFAENTHQKEGFVTFSELNKKELFLKQPSRGTCTLTSAAMMIRRAKMLRGDEDYMNANVQSVANVCWGRSGMLWSYTYDQIHVIHKAVSSTKELITLLKNHPEGIVAYDSWKPHAILLTDYDEDKNQFYCSDPATHIAKGRIPVEKAMISIQNVRSVWYVDTPKKLILKEEISVEDKYMFNILDKNNYLTKLTK